MDSVAVIYWIMNRSHGKVNHLSVQRVVSGADEHPVLCGAKLKYPGYGKKRLILCAKCLDIVHEDPHLWKIFQDQEEEPNRDVVRKFKNSPKYAQP